MRLQYLKKIRAVATQEQDGLHCSITRCLYAFFLQDSRKENEKGINDGKIIVACTALCDFFFALIEYSWNRVQIKNYELCNLSVDMKVSIIVKRLQTFPLLAASLYSSVWSTVQILSCPCFCILFNSPFFWRIPSIYCFGHFVLNFSSISNSVKGRSPAKSVSSAVSIAVKIGTYFMERFVISIRAIQ